MTQESIFIGLIGFSRSKFQDFEARILVLTSSWPQILRWNLISTQFCDFCLTEKYNFFTEKRDEKWAFLTKCSSDSDSAHRELSFRYGLASSGAHGAELWRFFIISKKLFKNGLLRQFCRPLNVERSKLDVLLCTSKSFSEDLVRCCPRFEEVLENINTKRRRGL